MKNRSYGMNIGASSILLIIVVLTLVSFAGLSLSSANADYKLCRKLSDRTQSYYEATTRGYEELCAAYKKESSAEDNSFSKDISINDNQVLRIDAVLNPSEGTRYNITTFKIVNIIEPELDESLDVFK